jgi:hypothetical protein
MASGARLVWLDRSAAPVPLEGATPLTIGRDPANLLCLAAEAGLSRHHAELRPAGEGRWLVCDLGSSNGTYVEGERLNGCRTLAPGDRIRLGRRGPLLQFLVGVAPEPVAPQPDPFSSGAANFFASVGLSASGSAPVDPSRPPATPPSAPVDPATVPLRSAPPTAGVLPVQPPAPSNPAVFAGSITVAGWAIPLEQIRGVEVRSQARHPHVFSWWVPACLGGLLLLPFPLLFWPWQATVLVVAILLGRRREHTLILTLRDGRAHRHVFADRPAALAHGQGVRRALGQVPGPDP